MTHQLKHTIAAAILAAAAIAPSAAMAGGKPADPDDRFRHWSVEASGLLGSDVWGAGAAANYHLNPYAGAGVGLVILGTTSDDAQTGTMPGGQTDWVAETGLNKVGALRAELLLTTPQLKLGSDREYGLALRVSPGIDVPIPVNRTVTVSYTPHQPGSYEVNHSDQVENHGGKALYGHCKVAALLTIDRLELSAGYEWSNFDVYGGARNISIGGTKLIGSDRKTIHAAFASIAYKF